jgi:hypothetical protein
LGFAPNPFHGVCTLACCKPQIRKMAEEGDYVLGTGAVKPNLGGHLTFWMQVNEIITFNDYWTDPRFRRKKPVMFGTTHLRYGDNIYHRNGKNFCQEYSFHSREDGSISLGDLKRDTGATEKVLIGRNFAFWGRSGIKVPDHLACCLKIGRPGHRRKLTDEQKDSLLQWLNALPERGYIDEPAHWQFL